MNTNIKITEIVSNIKDILKKSSDINIYIDNNNKIIENILNLIKNNEIISLLKDIKKDSKEFNDIIINYSNKINNYNNIFNLI